jgi:hypothetical protein
VLCLASALLTHKEWYPALSLYRCVFTHISALCLLLLSLQVEELGRGKFGVVLLAAQICSAIASLLSCNSMGHMQWLFAVGIWVIHTFLSLVFCTLLQVEELGRGKFGIVLLAQDNHRNACCCAVLCVTTACAQGMASFTVNVSLCVYSQICAVVVTGDAG